jgi:deoxyadenosine/deoxycytidine kinase
MEAVIALEGNIGVGKSTLSAKFKTIFPKKCAIYKEKGNDKFLQLFYNDPKTYGFAFQWGMLKTRQYQLRLAQHDTKYGRIPPRQFYFWDRSMIGDYIFALLNHMLGSISQNELAVYEDEFGGSLKSLSSISFFSAVNCYVLLNDEPENCKYRVEQLRANQSESSIPLSYYENLDDLHYSLFVDHLLPLKIVKILFLTWGQYNDPKSVWDLLLNIINLKIELPYVKKTQSLPEKEDPLNLIYTTAEQIEEFYKEMKFNEDSEKVKYVQKTFKTVYVPMGIMTIHPEQIKVNPYNINFYRNEYKRVVLWHLSQFQNVCFYFLNE